MSKRKKHLLKLVDKLKKIYFKNRIQIVSNPIDVNFTYEAKGDSNESPTIKKSSIGKTRIVKEKKKYNLPSYAYTINEQDFKNGNKVYLKNIQSITPTSEYSLSPNNSINGKKRNLFNKKGPI